MKTSPQALPAHASVWDRLTGSASGAAVTPEQLKRAISRDLETLLNTRVALPPAQWAAFPHCADSIVNFGLGDFAQLCLSSSDDRKTICDRLEATIRRHEPRLLDVRAMLVKEPGMVNRLSFVIAARLRVLADGERVRFNVKLEPSSLRYSIQ